MSTVNVAVVPRRQTPFEALAHHWRRDPGLIVSGSVILLMVLISLIGPFLLPSPTAQSLADRLQPPSAEYLLGTDEFGRDILSRVVSAGRVSLGIAAVITVGAVALGSLVGMVSGYYRRGSGVLMRFMDALMAFPAIVLAIALVVSLSSQAGALAEIIALTVVFTPYVARVIRSRTLVIAASGYIAAARVGGVSGPVILARHVLPNALPTILVQATFIYASALLADASLSFLGLGVAPPTPTWGNMIADAKGYMLSAPLFIVVPGAAIVVAVMAFNFCGDAIRTMIDPRARAAAELATLKRR